jgi:hypothetical protein
MKSVSMATRHARRVPMGALLALLVGITAGCAPLRPYRTVASANVDCTPGGLNVNQPGDPRFGAVPQCPANLIEEVAAGTGSDHRGAYQLHFIEYDDQGMLFPGGVPEYGQAHDQVNLFLSDLRRQLLDSRSKSTSARFSLVIFVHGWKNNAATNNANVRWFRAALTELSEVEAATCHRSVIGLYVGWRGAGTSLDTSYALNDFIEDFTFFSRQRAASRVGQGQIRELLARVRAIEDEANESWLAEKVTENETKDAVPRSPNANPAELCGKPVRMLTVGHSFGGRIVYTALAEALIRDMDTMKEELRQHDETQVTRVPVLEREGDTVVIISSAIEAATFVPLYEAAESDPTDGGRQNKEYIGQYHTPMLVSITSYNDWATREAYPKAALVTTLGYLYPKGDDGREKRAARETIGQDQDYINYRLMLPSQAKLNQQYGPITPDAACASINSGTGMEERAKVEYQRIRDFIAALKQHDMDANLSGVYPRQFCTDTGPGANPREYSLVLLPVDGKVNLNSPIWNVYTARPILNGHSDLLNPLLLDFLRQLYEEGGSPSIQLH